MSPVQILETAVSQLENFSKAEKGRRMESHKKPTPTTVKWRKPSFDRTWCVRGWIKFNWDATIDLERLRMGIGIIARDHSGTVLAAVSSLMLGITDPMGIGIIARDHSGTVLAAVSSLMLGITNPTTTEAVATWKMAEACVSLGYSKVILEGDSLEIVNSLQKDGCCWSRYSTMINDAKVLLDSI
jgi:hypothetical protein